MIRRAAACGGAVALLLLSLPAHAHEEMALHALTVLDAVEPNVPGLEVSVTHMGAPALVVRNRAGRTLSVLDAEGEGFLRIGAEGVRMNVESPLAYRSLNPYNDVVPPDVRSGAPSRWVRVSKEPAWTWFDPRLSFDRTDSGWTVPMALGGRALVVRGSYESLHGHGHFQSVLDPPEVDGLEIRLVEGPVPALFVRNDTGEQLRVQGQAGEPMLRIGPQGVEANLRSPSYYTSAAQTIAPVPSTADAAAEPRWKKVSAQPLWAWLEYRAAVQPEMQQRDVLGNVQTTVLEWDSPMVLGGSALDVKGRVEWLPPRTAATVPEDRTNLTPWWIAAVVIVGGGLAFGSIRRNAALA